MGEVVRWGSLQLIRFNGKKYCIKHKIRFPVLDDVDLLEGGELGGPLDLPALMRSDSICSLTAKLNRQMGKASEWKFTDTHAQRRLHQSQRRISTVSKGTGFSSQGPTSCASAPSKRNAGPCTQGGVSANRNNESRSTMGRQ